MMRAVGTVAMLLRRRVMIAVERMLDMLRRSPARFAEEGEEDQPPRIEAGEERGERARPEGDGARHRTACPRTLEDCVLRPEAGEPEALDADPGDRERADHHYPEGDRDLLP